MYLFILISPSYAGITLGFDSAMVSAPALFASTEEAIRFGKANPSAYNSLVKRRDQYLDKYKRTMNRLEDEDSDELWDLASKFATQAQFMREAYEQIPNGSCFYGGSHRVTKVNWNQGYQ